MCLNAIERMWRSENSLWKSILSYNVGLGHRTWVVKLDIKRLYLLSNHGL